MIDWANRHRVRAVLYALLLIGGIVMAAALTPQRIAGSRVAHWLAARWGVHYEIAGLQAGFAPCGFQVRSGPARFSVGGVEAAIAQSETCTAGTAALHGVDVNHLATVQSLEASLPANKAVASGVALPGLASIGELRTDLKTLASELAAIEVAPLLRIDAASSGAVRLPDIEWVKARGLRIEVRDPQAALLRVRALQARAAALAALPKSALEGAAHVLARVRSDLLLVLILATALLVGLKFAVFQNVLLAFAGSGLTYAFYYALRRALTPVPFLVLFTVASVALAVTLELVFYRRRAEWHQRWEPFAVDLLTPLLLMPILLAYGYSVTWPELRLPDRLRISSVRAENITTDLWLPDCSAAEVAHAEVPEFEARDLRLAPGELSADLALHGTGRTEVAPAPPVEFCAGIRVGRAGDRVPAVCNAPVAVAALVAPDLARSTARFWANVTGQDMSASLEGHTPGDVHLTALQSGAGSPVQIGGGSGTLSAASSSVVLRDLALQAAGTSVRVQRVSVIGRLPAGCRSNSVALTAQAGEIRVQRDAIEATVPLAELRLQAGLRGGTAGIRLLRAPGDPLFELARPVQFRADLQRGLFAIDSQPSTLRQTLVSQLPGSLDLLLSASLESRQAKGHVRIAGFSVAFFPVNLRLGQIDLSADSRTGVTIDTELNRISLPSVPETIQLRSVPSLSVRASGSLRSVPALPAFNVPAVPREIAFPLHAELPANGGAVRFNSTTVETHIQKATYPGLRLGEIRASSIATGDFGRVSTEAAITPEAAQLKIDAPQIKAQVTLSGSRVEFAVTEPAVVNGHLTESELDADAKLGSVPAGELGALRWSAEKASGHLHFDRITQKSQAEFDVTNGHIELPEGHLDATISGTIAADSSPSSSILPEIQKRATQISQHVEKARALFGAKPGASAPFSWQAEAANLDPKLPFLTAEPDRFLLRARSSFEGAGLRLNSDAALDLVAANGGLMVDGYVPASVKFREQALDVKLPLLLLLQDRLPPAPDLGSLGKLASSGPVRLFDRDRFLAGPFSVQQISLASRPLRAALGTLDRLEFYAPIESAILFGRASGVLRSDLRWEGTQGFLNAGADLNIEDLQAGALGWNDAGQHVAVLEDALSGKLSIGLRDVPIDRIDPLRDFDINLSLQGSQRPAGVLRTTADVKLRMPDWLLQQITNYVTQSLPPSHLRYRQLDLRFSTRGGLITSEVPLRIGGLQLFPNSSETNLNLHLTRGGPIGLRQLVDSLQDFSISTRVRAIR